MEKYSKEYFVEQGGKFWKDKTPEERSIIMKERYKKTERYRKKQNNS